MLDNAIPQGFEDAVELRRKNRETVVKYMNTKGQDRLRRHELFVEDGCGLGDGQVVALVSQVIVTADQTQATLLNRIVAYVFAGDTNQAAAIEHRASGIAVLQPGNLVGQCRIGIAIDLGLGVGDHIQQRLGDGQVIALVAQVVVTAVQCQVALVDARERGV